MANAARDLLSKHINRLIAEGHPVIVERPACTAKGNPLNMALLPDAEAAAEAIGVGDAYDVLAAWADSDAEAADQEPRIAEEG